MLLSLGSRSRPPLEPRACMLRATFSLMRQALASRISPPTSGSSPTTSPRCSSAGSTPHAAPPMASLRPPPIPDAPVAWPLLERSPGGRRTPVGVLGVPMDLGQDRRGVDMGPSAIRYARLNGALEDLGYPVTDLGNVETPIPETVEEREDTDSVDAIRGVCEEVAGEAVRMVSAGVFPVFLGGDHSISIGTVFGVIEAAGRTGLLWIDAHSDFNTPETSPSGNVHAMKDVDAYGVASVVRDALQNLAHLDRVHLSFDLDVVDPEVAPGVGTPVRGGLTYREAHLVMELINEAAVAPPPDVVEKTPTLDSRNETAELAVELVESLMG